MRAWTTLPSWCGRTSRWCSALPTTSCTTGTPPRKWRRRCFSGCTAISSGSNLPSTPCTGCGRWRCSGRSTRRRRRRRPVVALDSVAEPSTAAAPRDPLLEEVLRRLIATLAEGPRAVMILRYQEDLDPAEIADILEMPLGTVKSHLQRSLALLREKLERRGVGEI